MKKTLFILLIMILTGIAYGQQTKPETSPCERAEAREFDFLVGDWVETNDANSKMSIQKILKGCAIQEFWGEPYGAMLLRSYDAGKQKWFLTFLAENLMQHQVWEGRKESGQWRFYREWTLNGEKILSRTYWNPLENGFEKIVEQSRDDGKTWKPHAKQQFRRKT
jgi:hypothetical protein